VKTSLTLLRAMPITLVDYYYALSVTKLLGYSVGTENVMETEKVRSCFRTILAHHIFSFVHLYFNCLFICNVVFIFS